MLKALMSRPPTTFSWKTPGAFGYFRKTHGNVGVAARRRERRPHEARARLIFFGFNEAFNAAEPRQHVKLVPARDPAEKIA